MIVPIWKKQKWWYDFQKESTHCHSNCYVQNLQICFTIKLQDHSWIPDAQFAYKWAFCVYVFLFWSKWYVIMVNRTLMCVCFLDVSKVFDCVNHWKLFKGMVECKCPALIIRHLMYWYRNHKLCVKWNNFVYNKVSMGNGIEHGGILSPNSLTFMSMYWV